MACSVALTGGRGRLLFAGVLFNKPTGVLAVGLLFEGTSSDPFNNATPMVKLTKIYENRFQHTNMSLLQCTNVIRTISAH